MSSKKEHTKVLQSNEVHMIPKNSLVALAQAEC